MGKRVLFVPTKPTYSEYYEDVLFDFDQRKANIIKKYGVKNPLNKNHYKPTEYQVVNKKLIKKLATAKKLSQMKTRKREPVVAMPKMAKKIMDDLAHV